MTGVSQLAPGTSLSTHCPRDLVTNWGEVGEGCLAYAKSCGPSELQLLYPLRTAFPVSPGTWLQAAAAQSPTSALFAANLGWLKVAWP